MHLDLWNAEVSTDITTTKGVIHLRSFVHADEMMIIVKATTEGDEHDFQWEWIAAEANSPRYLIFKRQGKANKIPKDYELNPTAKSVMRKKSIYLSRNYWQEEKRALDGKKHITPKQNAPYG